MSTTYCLNSEVIFAKAIESYIAHMSDSNYKTDASGARIPDEEAFLNNLSLGVLALNGISNYLVCCLNSLIAEVYNETYLAHHTELDNNPFGISQDEVNAVFRRRSVKDKLKEMVKLGYINKNRIDPEKWHSCVEIIDFSNEITHYRVYFTQDELAPHYDCWFMPQGKQSVASQDREQITSAFTAIDPKKSLAQRLTQSWVQYAWDSISELIKIVIDVSNHRLQPNVLPVAIHTDELPGSYIAHL